MRVNSRCNEHWLDILGGEIRVCIEEIWFIKYHNQKRFECMYYLSKYLLDVHEDLSLTWTQDKENTMFDEEVLCGKETSFWYSHE